MKKYKIFILTLLLTLVAFSAQAQTNSTVDSLSPFRVIGNNIIPRLSSWIFGTSTMNAVFNNVTINGTCTGTGCGTGGSTATTTINGVQGPLFTFNAGTGISISTSTGQLTFTGTTVLPQDLFTTSTPTFAGANIGTLNVTQLAESPFLVGGSASTTIVGDGTVSTFGGGATFNGSVGVATTTTSGRMLNVAGGGSGINTLVVGGNSSNNADIQQWRNSTGTILSGVDKNGRLYAGGVPNASLPAGIKIVSTDSTDSYFGAAIGAKIAFVEMYGGEGYFSAYDYGGSANIPINIGGNTTDIKFLANGSQEKMRITSAGNIGIGTTTPAAKLSVVASSTGGAGIINMTNTGVTADNRLVFNMYSNGTLWSDWGVEGNGSSGVLTDMYFRNFTDKPINFFTNNLQRMTITGAGNIGIGTTTPASPLQVVGDTTLDTALFRSTTAPTLKAYNPGTLADTSQLTLYPNSGTNVASGLSVIPRGTGVSQRRAQLNVFNTDYIADPTNYEFSGFRATDNLFTFASGKAGTGRNLPIMFSAGYLTDSATNNGQIYLATSSYVGISTTTPSSALDIVGTSTASAYRVRGATQGSMFYVGDTNGTLVEVPNNTVTTTLKFLSQFGNNMPTWQTVPNTGAYTYFFLDSTSTTSGGYKDMGTATSSAMTSIVMPSLSNTSSTVMQWITATGTPMLTNVPGGLWSLHIDATRNSGNGTLTYYFQVFKYNGAETLLYETQASAPVTSSNASNPQEIDIEAFLPQQSLAIGDRLVVRVREIVSGTNTVGAVYYQGITESRVSLPSNTIDATNFVPYVGATQNLNLGTNSILAANIYASSTWIKAVTPGTSGYVLTSDGTNWISAPNTGGVTSIIAGAGISVSNATGTVTIAATGSAGVSTTTQTRVIELPSASEDDFFWYFPEAATTTKVTAVNKTNGDTVTFNLVLDSSRSTATSSAQKVFSSYQTVTATTTPTSLTISSSSIPAGSVMRLVTSAASSTQFTVSVTYQMPAMAGATGATGATGPQGPAGANGTSTNRAVTWSASYSTSTSQFVDPMFTFTATSTIDKIFVVSRDSANTLDWNMFYGSDPTAATSSMFKVLSATRTTTSTPTNATAITSFASSTPGAGQTLHLYSANASSTITTFTVWYHEQ